MEATTAATEAEATTTDLSQAGRLSPLEREAAGSLIGELFAEHGRMVLGLCRLLLRDRVEAEDAAQQVFLSAHLALLRGSEPRDAAAWLAAIARTECRARIRLRMREPLALQELPSDLPDPLAAAIRATDLQAVWSALGTLPRRQRRALVMRELGGLSYHELGRALGVSHSAVESLLFRARQRVRALVAGANVAAVPVALRDELARLIPGFDPGSASVVARVAALPVAWKLASTAVGVGVVATGAGGLHHGGALRAPHEPVAQARHAPSRAAVVSARPRVAQPAAPSLNRRHGRRAERRRHNEIESVEHEREDPVVESTGSQGPGPGPAPVAAQTASRRQSSSGPGPGGGAPEGNLEDDSGSGNSGHGGGSEPDDSGHSGPG